MLDGSFGPEGLLGRWLEGGATEGRDVLRVDLRQLEGGDRSVPVRGKLGDTVPDLIRELFGCPTTTSIALAQQGDGADCECNTS